MPRNACDAASSAGVRRDPKVATPRAELNRLDRLKAKESERIHGEIMEAVLTLSGEDGYRNVAVQQVIERYGGYRLQFYRHFKSKADCFTAAYEVEIERLYAGVIAAAGSEQSWPEALRAGLEFLAGFIEARPAFARGLLIEVHVVGGPSLAKREEVFERLSHALDSARRETRSRHSPPPVTGMFIVGAIEESVADVLAKGEPKDFALAIPELVKMATVAYFGDQA